MIGRIIRSLLVLFLVSPLTNYAADGKGPVKNKIPATTRPPRPADRNGVKNSPTAAAPSAPHAATTPAPPAAKQPAPERAPALELLRQQVSELKWNEEPLDAVIDWISDHGTANVVVLWKTLEDLGIDSQTRVSMQLRNVSVQRVLTELCGQLSPAGGVGFEASGDTIKIASQRHFDSILYTRTYDVNDIVVEIPDFSPGPEFGGVAKLGAGGGTGEISIPLPMRMEEFASVIRKTVAPGRWDDGNGDFSLEVWKSYIVVRAPVWVHEQIGGPFYR